MPPSSNVRSSRSRWLPPVGLALLFFMLLIAGGASRADVSGQIVIRLTAWLLLLAAVLFGPRPALREVRPVVLLLGCAIALPALQLVPLPPGLWTALPGRELFMGAATAAGEPQPWRPLSISPDATRNALSSLVVPLAALLLATMLPAERRPRLAILLLIAIGGSAVLGLLQFSGSRFDNPLINTVTGSVAGSFANRNHFALFLAFGCVLAPVWPFLDPQASRLKLVTAAGVLAVFLLMILATGSRAGIVLGGLGTVLGLLAARRRLVVETRMLPRRTRSVLWIALVGGLALAVGLSVLFSRAVSFDRAFAGDAVTDIRGDISGIVAQMVARYFPVGTGYGTFDPAFRIEEPFAMLMPQYVNHAHNDWLEVVLDGGIPGLVLLGVGVLWWAWRSVGAWRMRGQDTALTARAGSAMIALTLLASLIDYPARTPMIMAAIVIAAVWLASGRIADRTGERRVNPPGRNDVS